MRFKLFLILALSALAVRGQDFSWGIKGGANVNDIYIKTDHPEYRDLLHSTTSFHGGVFAKIGQNRKFSFIPELQFIQKGFAMKTSGYSAKYTINYIEIPILFSYSVFKYLNVELGQVSGFKISAYGHVKESQINMSKTYYDMSKSYYTFDFGLTAGIRIKVNERIGLSSRYVWSLNALGKNGPILGPGVYKESNRNLLFSLTYLLKKSGD